MDLMARDVHTDSGKYNRPCQIQKLVTRTDDGQGGNSTGETWQTICSPFIHLYSVPNGRGSTRLYQYMQLYPAAKHWAELRYRATPVIDGTMTLLHRGRRYQILDAQNMDEENVTILLPLVEYQAKGTQAS